MKTNLLFYQSNYLQGLGAVIKETGVRFQTGTILQSFLLNTLADFMHADRSLSQPMSY